MRRAGMAVAAACVVVLGGCRKSAAPEASPPAPPAAEGVAPAPAEAPAEAPAAAPAAEAPVPAGAEAPVAPAPPAQPGQNMRILTVRLGPEPGEGPSNFEGGMFRSGSEVTAAVDASSLPPGAIVKVNWFDANGADLGQDHKQVTSGVPWLSFTAPGSSSWADGTYRVEFAVSTGGYGTENFLIGDLSARPTPQPG